MSRYFFVTGASGVLGSEIVPLLLNEPDTRVGILLRAKSEQELATRFNELLEYWDCAENANTFRERIDPIAGDVTQLQLGVNVLTYQKLVGTVTNIIHSAANLRLNQDYASAHSDTVGGLAHIMTLAKACIDTGNFQKLDYVSTIGVSGRMSGSVPETPLRRQTRSFRNSYEAAKSAAEDLLTAEMSSGFPATIYRPSMIVGNSHNEKIRRRQVFYYLTEFLSGRSSYGIVPQFGNFQLDIIPIDFVASAIHYASQRNDAIGRIFHLCLGKDRAPKLTELASIIQRTFNDAGLKCPALIPVNKEFLSTAVKLLASLSSGRMRKKLATIPLFIDHLNDDQTFAVSNTNAYYKNSGLPSLPPVNEFVIPILNYYLEYNARKFVR